MGSKDPLPNPPQKGEGEKLCPFCRSGEIDVISLFGSQVMTMQCRCRKCGNYFEASKY